MNNTYIIKKTKIIVLLNEIDSFKTKMDLFNKKYNNIYNYGIDIYSETDDISKGKLYIAEINIKRDEKNTLTISN